MCVGVVMVPIGNARQDNDRNRASHVAPGVGMWVSRHPYDNHQRVEMVVCMLLPTPTTLKEKTDEVSRKGSHLDGLYHRP